MSMFFLLTGIGFLLFVVCIVGLVWMVRSGQLDDLDTPSLRMLADDPPAEAMSADACPAHLGKDARD